MRIHVCDREQPGALTMWCRIWNTVRPDRARTPTDVTYEAARDRRCALWIATDIGGRPNMALKLVQSRWLGETDPPELVMACIPPIPADLHDILVAITPTVRAWGFHEVSVETRDTRAEQAIRAALADRGFQLRHADVEAVLPIADARRWDPPIPPHLRVVRLADAPQLAQSAHECFALADADEPNSSGGAVMTHEAFLAELTAPWTSLDDCLVAVTADDQVVGWAHLERFAAAPSVGWNGFTGTHPDFRGQGIASILKHALLDRATECGLAELRTENAPLNQPIRRLNARLGYRPIGTIEWWNGLLPN